MPHKRAKRTVREQVKKERGSDLGPTNESLQNEAIPKSASRILNAHSIREDWKLKRKRGDGVDLSPKQKRRKTEREKNSLKIQPGESMQHFNRRVEDDLRPLVKSAAQAARIVSRGVARSETEARSRAKKVQETHKSTEQAAMSPSPPVDKHASRPKEFAVAASSAPRRLNDIAQAPPELKQLPRGAMAATSKRDSILSMSQKLMMEEERAKAIARYRELKASRKRTTDQDEGV